ncbi:MAG: hypothetical protein ABW171_19025 [Steroidobacter sp.]
MSARSTSPFRPLLLSLIVVAAALLSGCATIYVDTKHQSVDASQIRKPQRPQDVQLLFTFQSKGTSNARATEYLKADVTRMVAESGLFAVVGSDPSLSGATISIIINNVPEEGAVGKGVATGLTMGLAGNVVADNYVCTVDYLAVASGSKLSKISKTATHSIYTTVGAKGAPPNATKAKNIDEAVRTMSRQIVTAALKDLSTDPTFK